MVSAFSSDREDSPGSCVWMESWVDGWMARVTYVLICIHECVICKYLTKLSLDLWVDSCDLTS